MSRLILLCGWGGSGKDYAIDEAVRRAQIDDVRVKSYTTRKPRYEGENTHTFVDYNFYISIMNHNRHDIVAKTVQNNNLYFTTIDSLRDKSVYIIDPPGIRYFINKMKDKKFVDRLQEIGIYDITIIYLKQSRIKIAYNLLFRRKVGIKETIRRMKQDKELYKNIDSCNPIIFKSQEMLITYLELILTYREFL